MQKQLRSFTLSAILCLTGFSWLSAQVNLTATGGTLTGTYTTVGGAFTAINAGTHTGMITLSLSGNTTETATASINASGSGSASYTSVTITTTTPVIISGNLSGAIIKLNGADNVILDGRIGGTGRNITVQNTNTSASSAGIWIASTGAGAGARLNIVRNCEIICGVAQNTATTTTYGVIMTGSTISTTTGGADNDSNQFLENRFTKVRYALVTRGESSGNLNEGTLIQNNIIGPNAYGTDEIGKVGILVMLENNCEISGNTIQYVGGTFANTSGGADRVGIALGSDSWTPTTTVGTNFNVHHNLIHDVVDERTFSSIGILHAAANGANPTNHRIYNNFLYNIHSNGTSGDQGLGIGIAAGAGDLIVYNSISMTEGDIDPTGTTTGTQSNCGIRILSATPTDLVLKNNIIQVDLSSNTATLNHYCIVAPSGSYSWGTGGLNNNNYWINAANTQMKIGGTGTAVPYTPFATFANWKTNFSASQDLNSQNVNPAFISATNLHINNASPSNLESKAIAIAGITTDIDNDVRPGPAGSVNGGGVAPDIGADEFDGIPLLIDMGVLSLLNPQTSGCHGNADTVKVRLKNYSIITHNFATTPVTINASVTGTNPTTFTPVTISSGTLPASGTIDIVISTGYNMTATGNYTFHSKATAASDGNTGNDSITPVTITISGGTVNISDTSTCALEPVDLLVSGYTNGGSVQWQYFSPTTLTWTNLAGATTNPYSALLTDSTDHFRALICNANPSNADSIHVITVPQATAADVVRCGPGTAVLQTTVPPGATSIAWYTVPVGGTPVDTNLTFTTPFLTSSTSYYLEALGGTAAEYYSVGYINTAGYSFLTQTNGWGLMFTANTDCVLDSVGVYPTGTGTINIEILDPSNNVLFTGPTVNITGTGTQKIMVPIGATLAPGNYKLGQNSTGVTNLGSQTTGSTMAYPFVSPPLTITSGSQGTGPVANVYYWFYDLRVHTGSSCSSARDTVTVTLTPSDSIHPVAVSNPLCSNQTTAINVNSANANYQYTWSPAAGLNTTNGASVITGSDTTITYSISAIDNTTQCAAYNTITINVLEAPQVTVVTPDTALCMNSSLQLEATASSHVASYYNIGFAANTNTATSTTILGPYGGSYGGARHQYLVTAAELSAAGMSAGTLDKLAFEVTALNSVPALTDYTIKMGTTALSALTLSFTPSLQTVYYTPSYTPVLGWNQHDIAPFYWDGTSNILVEVCFNNVTTGVSSGNASVRYTTTAGSVVYYRADNDPNVCGMLSGTTGSSRPDIRFYRSAPVSYLWSPATGLSNTSMLNPMLTAVSSNVYALTVLDSLNGCSASDNVSITVNPNPVFSIGADTLVCDNAPLTPFAIFGSNINLSYVWFDNTTGSGAIVNAPGSYYATGTDANGCSSGDTMMVGTIAPANVDINVNIITSNMAELDAGSGFTSYDWSNSQTTQVTTVTGNGTYWVQVTDANGCANSDTISIVFSLGISNQDGSTGELAFYPNPSSGMINMAGTNINTNALKVDILDIRGNIVYTRNIEQPGENFLQQIDLSSVAAGTYVVRVQTEKSVFSNRIIIARN